MRISLAEGKRYRVLRISYPRALFQKRQRLMSETAFKAAPTFPFSVRKTEYWHSSIELPTEAAKGCSTTSFIVKVRTVQRLWKSIACIEFACRETAYYNYKHTDISNAFMPPHVAFLTDLVTILGSKIHRSEFILYSSRSIIAFLYVKMQLFLSNYISIALKRDKRDVDRESRSDAKRRVTSRSSRWLQRP